ncbi:hypothetical protein AU152_gp56 [Mycobacterium phage Phlei]|uniref:Uncharacterized protein n=1 Tax=Mycobacterium phage Phlei TaxID=1690684 RepID=A0A0N7E4J1_9CAUD|nr:hypothetical protein AU152_gp56 [Mycobacterium phage Phlei]ALA48169.1 hypothetical protein [Mycobacterium phage Phlei]
MFSITGENILAMIVNDTKEANSVYRDTVDVHKGVGRGSASHAVEGD